MTSKEEAILRAQQLDLIYAQSGILYEIILKPPRSNTNFVKLKPRPHVDGMVHSFESPTIESLAKQKHKLSVKQYEEIHMCNVDFMLEGSMIP